jgi:hypothetical protein
VGPVLAVLAGFALIAALLAWSRWLAGRRWAAAGHLLLTALLALALVGGWPILRYVQTFTPRAPERPVAELFFERIGPGRFRAAVTHLPTGRMQVVDLAGDEWRLDLRLLDWTEGAARLGARPRCRVEAVSSRTGPAATTGLPRGATARLTGGEEPAPWPARLGASLERPLLATRSLHGPWLPLVDGARFDVRVNAADAIEVDPLNVVAGDALAAR